jgi:hypothetical protein
VTPGRDEFGLAFDPSREYDLSDVVKSDNTTGQEVQMATAKTRTKGKGKKAAPLNPVFESNPTAQAIVKGHTVERRMDYGRLLDANGTTIGQVAARKGDVIVLERLHEDTNVPASLEPAGKDGAIRGRYRVTAKQVGIARKTIEASARLVAKADATKRPTTKVRVLSGQLAEVAAANPDLAEQGKDMKRALGKKVGVKVKA